jgi:hypothetical protein
MKLDDIRQIIAGSTAADWQEISGSRLFIYAFGEVVSADEHRVTVDYHHSLAVYREDVSLRLAWGLEEERDLEFDRVHFPYSQTRRAYADAFWQGALVARWTYLIVDGGRCYLPEIEPVYEGKDEDPEDSSKWHLRGYQAYTGDIAMARLLNDLVGRPEEGAFERYMEQASIAEAPDPV